jgi:hypothetical protein
MLGQSLMVSEVRLVRWVEHLVTTSPVIFLDPIKMRLSSLEQFSMILSSPESEHLKLKKITTIYAGGLDLSRSCLNRDSQSRHWQKVSLDGRENLESFKKLVSTIEKTQSRYLDFVLTPPSSLKSCNQD